MRFGVDVSFLFSLLSKLANHAEFLFYTDSRTHLVHAGNFLIYLFLCACTVEQVERSYSLLETYHHALRFLAAMADENSMGMLRPALLRIESFFKEAVEIMRKGVGRRG